MPLKIGSRVGPYEISAPLGSGGMGEVYVAEDTRLHRKVALKFVREELVQNQDTLQRFEREARLLASLNHPNIASLYGLEEGAGVRALVLELVEGPTLLERIRRERLPLPEAIRIARQIAEALEAAHARGIIHRDLKPGNVKLTPAGTVKVLDFGLAKILGPKIWREGASELPTLTEEATREGAVIGTAPYMSPEQIRGGSLDFRTDIWSFGCVLFEMLAGRPAFPGRGPAEIGAAILEREPEWDSLPPGTPNELRRLVRRCLRKDPVERVHHIADVRIELDDLQEGGGEPGAPVPGRPGWRSRPALLGLAAGALLGAVLTLALLWPAHPPSNGRPGGGKGAVRFTAELPAGLKFASDITREVAISPDGLRLAFAASDGTNTRLYLRSMREDAALPIAGTEGALAPFFSPDGKWIGYFTLESLRKVPVSGGEPVDICRGRLNLPGLGAAWGPDGTIVVGSAYDSLHRVPAAGGEMQSILNLDRKAGEEGQRFPEFLPDGRTVIFAVSFPIGAGRIEALDLKTGNRRLLIEGGDGPEYVEGGYLVYSRGQSVIAARFDAGRVEVTGPPLPLLGGIASGLPYGIPHFAVSPSGSLAYIAAEDVIPRRRLLRVDRKGLAEVLSAGERGYSTTRLSPDGMALAVATWELQDTGIWVSPIDRLALARLPLDGVVFSPAWRPDGRHITYFSGKEKLQNIFTAPIDGSTAPEPLGEASRRAGIPLSWSADGQSLLYWKAFRIMLGRWREGDGPMETETVTDPGASGTVSPDGHWLAYSKEVDDLRNLVEIFVQEFPKGGGQRRISLRGGAFPAWSPRGDELFFVRGAQVSDSSLSKAVFATGDEDPSSSKPEFISVKVTPGSNPVFGEERVLFSKDLEYGGLGFRFYDVAPDAQSFLVPGPDRSTAPPRIHVIAGWADELGNRIHSSP